MHDFLTIFHDHPWVLWLVIAGVTVWGISLAVVFKSPKFRRKWLWVIVSLVAFTFAGWETAPGTTVSVGVPIGAMYILGYWLFAKPGVQ